MYESQQPTTPGMHWSWANLIQVAQNMATPFAQNYQASRQLRLEEKRQQDANNIALAQVQNEIRRIQQADDQLAQQYMMHSETLGLEKERLEHQQEVDRHNQKMAEIMADLQRDQLNASTYIASLQAEMTAHMQNVQKFGMIINAKTQTLASQASLEQSGLLWATFLQNAALGQYSQQYYNYVRQLADISKATEFYDRTLKEVNAKLENHDAYNLPDDYYNKPNDHFRLFYKDGDDEYPYALEVDKVLVGKYNRTFDSSTQTYKYTFRPFSINVDEKNSTAFKNLVNYASTYGHSTILKIDAKDKKDEYDRVRGLRDSHVADIPTPTKPETPAVITDIIGEPIDMPEDFDVKASENFIKLQELLNKLNTPEKQ